MVSRVVIGSGGGSAKPRGRVIESQQRTRPLNPPVRSNWSVCSGAPMRDQQTLRNPKSRGLEAARRAQ